MDETTKTIMKMSMLLGESRALIRQLFARGDFEFNGQTERQVNLLVHRIDETVGR